MKFIKRAKRGAIILSAVYFLTGAALFCGLTISPASLCLLSGIFLILYGAVRLLGFFSRDPYRLAFQFDYAYGLLSLTAGCLLMLFSEAIVTFLFPFWGLYTLFDGVLKLQTSRDARLFGLEHWWMILLLATVTCIAGIMVLLMPEASVNSERILGLSCGMSGASNTCIVAYTVRTPKRKGPIIPLHNESKTPKGIYEKI